jgi:phosphopantothenate---cysteine ligase (CTP)
MRALVTAGGTSEPIDDVRVVTNLSTGRLGAELANALVASGAEVTLLAGRSLASHPEWVDHRVTVIPFGGFADLQASLEREIEHRPDLVLMAAAVSDYSPARAPGKLSSAADELVVVMQRNPKLLSTLRDRLGPGPRLVGFKLLAGVEPDELVDTARRQVARDRLDLCVANDLAELTSGNHPVWLVPADGPAIHLEGDKARVAELIVAYLLGRTPPAARAGHLDSPLAEALQVNAGEPLHPWPSPRRRFGSAGPPGRWRRPEPSPARWLTPRAGPEDRS